MASYNSHPWADIPSLLPRFLPFLLLTMFPVVVSAQLSPGPLSAAHSALEGPTKCTECHEFGVAEPQLKCVNCHTEIRDRLRENRGYHARYASLKGRGQDCALCHAEHFGRDHQLVYYAQGRDAFDHGETGYPLEGRHAGLACNKCHNGHNVSPAVLAELKVQDPARTLLGLPRTCAGCHEDQHRGQLGQDCASCHSFETWKKAAGFDHARTDFPLTGKHASVECGKCHKAGPEGAAQYKGLGTACADCHTDPHKSAFPGACDQCHQTNNWNARLAPASFDHSKTDFPLKGKHAATDCRKCHDGVDFSRPIAHTTCADCHRDDPHGGQFNGRPGGSDCAACHVEDHFVPSTYGVAEHMLSGYPLEGKHRTVKCVDCHRPAGPNAHYRLAHDQCRACHTDAHAGQFAGSPHQDRCDDCHTVDRFQPATFTAAAHEKTAFPLAGAHRAVSCVDCHSSRAIEEHAPHAAGDASHPAAAGLPGKLDLFHFPALACYTCHSSPHGDQFLPPATSSEYVCADCHTDRSWTRLAPFDHGRTEFALEGAHREVACGGCHHRPDSATGVRGVRFDKADTQCAGCHEDPHGGQFETANRARNCQSCHTNVDWQPTRFDHDRYSSFSLKGAHADVPCRSCHAERRQVNGVAVITYRGTPRECEQCHEAGSPVGRQP